MKSKKIFKILTLLLPMITTFSCSFPKNKLNSNNVDTFYEQETNKSKQQLTNFSEDNFDETLEKLKKGNTIYFPFNNHQVNSKYAKNLNDLAQFLCHHSNQKIMIEGHTDSRGTNKYNMYLGQKRADSVKLYLESKGVSNQQITTVSYGSSKPVAHGNKENSYSKNRRSVIIYQ
ncbi:peptidoglycan-associated lipoprotein precursor [Buchnera aphidicola str. Bp (Baizongia pistaciae)]|uniref:Peptidoglycan-associated lipoprotein n=1 Tax=Buchnera aphidicola subsp. Baizongia pistaciae (strain Bp) TaxID=224915 RepID=PAL_BUCBP|nr:OmpA family protein [Buchnera aphidicola]Q89AJ5.1 RecName: Full=Peptidoglycan-associated lipoprotein; Short=PAL; Flags: Precursor [Buchnera aphidicola str. Bp (Baizongia pistaciae)]AAO27007.1 peptidoglycan-associated lipoprotein precursor [Buchnera aphidicola str. Bp (Baizongia pistaciae)]